MATVCLTHPFSSADINNIAAVEVCLACCAACFVGIIENLVEYFNRSVLFDYAMITTH